VETNNNRDIKNTDGIFTDRNEARENMENSFAKWESLLAQAEADLNIGDLDACQRNLLVASQVGHEPFELIDNLSKEPANQPLADELYRTFTDRGGQLADRQMDIVRRLEDKKIKPTDKKETKATKSTSEKAAAKKPAAKKAAPKKTASKTAAKKPAAKTNKKVKSD
jgi:hypothetical protein